MTPLARILGATVAALSVGLTFVVLLRGWSGSGPLRIVQVLAVITVVGGALLSLVAAIGLRLAGWSDPESEAEFDQVVLRAERQAREGLAVPPDEHEFLALDPHDDEDFEELVQEAIDALPDLLHQALERNVAVTISDEGRRHGAYGLYRGDTATRDEYADQIIIFRDTLRRDFGHDADLLREQVTITVRHELAHHIGFDELGVRDLGL